jgi:hypothetical protein
VPRRNRRQPTPPPTPGFDPAFAARRRAACASKQRYDSEAEARSIALMNAPPGRPAATKAYQCDVCGFWHLTSA